MFGHFIVKVERVSETYHGLETNNLSSVVEFLKLYSDKYYDLTSSSLIFRHVVVPTFHFGISNKIIQLPTPDLKLYLFNLIKNYNYAIHVDEFPVFISQGAYQTDEFFKKALRKPYKTIEWFSFYSGLYQKYKRKIPFDWKKEGF